MGRVIHIFLALPRFKWVMGDVQATAVKIDRRFEVMLLSESPRRVLHPLDLSINRLAGRIGDALLQVRQDVRQSCLEGAGHFDTWLQPDER